MIVMSRANRFTRRILSAKRAAGDALMHPCESRSSSRPNEPGSPTFRAQPYARAREKGPKGTRLQRIEVGDAVNARQGGDGRRRQDVLLRID